jgi:ribose transport system substrate-binding protein
MDTLNRKLAAISAASLAMLCLPAYAETAEDVMMKEFGSISNDPTIIETVEHVAMPVTPQILEKALECYRNNVCDTGTGGTLSVAYADGFGENVWRQVSKMEFILQALTYPNIGKIQYTSARGDFAKALSDMNSFIAQGVDFILLYPDAGEAMTPVMKEATDAGILVALHAGPSIGVAGQDYLTNVFEDVCELAAAHVRAVKEGNPKATEIVGLGGTPGNTLSANFQGCAKPVAEELGMKIVDYYDTNWTQEGTFQAVTAALAKFGSVDGWIYEYADGFRGGVRAYEAANKPVDTVAAVRTDEQGLFCDWERINNPNFKVYYSSAYNITARIALTAALRKLAGEEVPPYIKPPFKMKELVKGHCDPALPMEASITTTLNAETMKAMFGD